MQTRIAVYTGLALSGATLAAVTGSTPALACAIASGVMLGWACECARATETRIASSQAYFASLVQHGDELLPPKTWP